MRTTSATPRHQVTIRDTNDHQLGNDVDTAIANAPLEFTLPRNPRVGQSVRVVAAGGDASVSACDPICGADESGTFLVSECTLVDFTFTVDECDCSRKWVASQSAKVPEPICRDFVLEIQASAVAEGDVASGTGAGASNFGNFTFTFEETNTVPEYSGTEVLTFDDGSTITREYTGFFADNGAFIQSATITGGTGRFAGASGTSIQAGEAEFTDVGFDWIGTDRGQLCTPPLL